MLSRRICYLAALMGCAGFYVAHGEWVSWVLLVCVAGLPWLSLILSLPAMLRFRMWVQAPAAVALGVEAQAELLGSSDFPLPPFRGKLRVTPCIAGAPFYYRESKGLPTQVCGGLKVEIVKGKVCDYLGLTYEADTASWREVYGRRLEVSVELTAYSPGEEGAAGCTALLERAHDALLAGLAEGLRPGEMTWETAGWDRETERLCQSAVLQCTAAFVAQALEEPGLILDFKLKGVPDFEQYHT